MCMVRVASQQPIQRPNTYQRSRSRSRAGGRSPRRRLGGRGSGSEGRRLRRCVGGKRRRALRWSASRRLRGALCGALGWTLGRALGGAAGWAARGATGGAAGGSARGGLHGWGVYHVMESALRHARRHSQRAFDIVPTLVGALTHWPLWHALVRSASQYAPSGMLKSVAAGDTRK